MCNSLVLWLSSVGCRLLVEKFLSESAKFGTENPDLGETLGQKWKF